MALLVRKIADLQNVNRLLRGGIIGGRTIKSGLFRLDGTTLVFTTPSVTVTFVTSPASPEISLGLSEILTQINAALGAGFAKFFEGRLLVQNPTAVAPIVLASGTALAAFGFDANGATGVVYNEPGGVAPALVSIGLTSLSSSTYVVVTEEV